MKEKQCNECLNFNELWRHSCLYCGSRNLKVVGETLVEMVDRVAPKLRIVEVPVSKLVENIELLGPAFMQCGKITKFIPDGVELCGKPMYHEGEC